MYEIFSHIKISYVQLIAGNSVMNATGTSNPPLFRFSKKHSIAAKAFFGMGAENHKYK